MILERKTPEELESEKWTKMAASIRKIGTAMDQIKNSGLSRNAISILLASSTGLTLATINKVINEMERLPEWCLNRPRRN